MDCSGNAPLLDILDQQDQMYPISEVVDKASFVFLGYKEANNQMPFASLLL
jgi:hypothetical protein